MAINVKQDQRLDQVVIDRLVKTTLLKLAGKSCLDCSNCTSNLNEPEIYCYTRLKMIDDGYGYGNSEVCHKFETKKDIEFSHDSISEELAF